MVRGTSTSRKLLTGYFDQMVQHIQAMYSVNVWFAEIMGRRWSCIAGRTEEGAFLFPPRRIELTDRFGIISDGWGNIPADESETIISLPREAVKVYE